jgi:hypothetical protein
MAPSNLSQVFVVNNVTMLTGSTFATSAASANASKFGIWDLDSSAFINTDITAKKRIQFVQSTVGSGLLATPIIDVADIVRINYNEYDSTTTNPSTRPRVSKAVIDAGAAAAAATSASDPIIMKIAVRTAPTAYEYFANNANPYADLSYSGSGASYDFPILGNFSAGRMLFNIEVPESVHSPSASYSETALITALFNGIQNNPTLKAIFAATDSGASGLELVARHYGVFFDVTLSQNGVKQGTVTMSMVDATSASNYILAISDEKSQRARYGNFNRMYFPVTQTDYAQPLYKYDILEITYKHGHPASTGIARAGELNTLKVYFGSSSTALAAAADFAAAFSIAIGTNEEQVTDIALQS